MFYRMRISKAFTTPIHNIIAPEIKIIKKGNNRQISKI